MADGQVLQVDDAGVLVVLLLPHLLVVDDGEGPPLAVGLLEAVDVGHEGADDLVLAVGVVVVDVEAEGALVVAVAELAEGDLEGSPAGVLGVLDHLALVDHGEGALANLLDCRK